MGKNEKRKIENWKQVVFEYSSSSVKCLPLDILCVCLVKGKTRGFLGCLCGNFLWSWFACLRLVLLAFGRWCSFWQWFVKRSQRSKVVFTHRMGRKQNLGWKLTHEFFFFFCLKDPAFWGRCALILSRAFFFIRWNLLRRWPRPPYPNTFKSKSEFIQSFFFRKSHVNLHCANLNA